MEYRQLGRTDMRVSALCLGTMTWGEQNTQDEAFEQMDRAVAAGINFLDTAELYPVPPKAETQGRTETIIGHWFKSRGCRDKVILATKAAGPGDWVSYIRGGPRFNAKHLTQALNDSLRRLQTDYVDLYQLHWPDRNTNFFGRLGYEPDPDEQQTPILETLEVLADFVKAGKVRAIGLSNETPWGVSRFLHYAESLGLPRVASIQNPYNLLNRTFEVGLAEFAHREQVGLLAYSPLAFGVLSGKYLGGPWPEGARITLFKRFSRYLNAQGIAATEAYVKLARTHGLSPVHMALQFVTTRPFVTSNIIGATTLAQLEENLASLDTELSDEVLQGIEEIHEQYRYPCP
ncbi:MAG: NADP(H)-dependent aldo-keto reductase [Gammaproteobacteria bacterium]|nr:MAG: NADP(H)-dependent aldo-keto reductase [Gammaproteobacteria bacterium]